MNPARRLTGLSVSAIRRISDGAPADAIPLGLGEPTWPLAEAGRRALAAFGGVCGYGPQVGIPELRRAVGALYDAAADEVMITNGTQEALYDVCQAYLNPGDRVLVPTPGFIGYRGVAHLAGAESVEYALDEARGFALDADAFRAALDAHEGVRLAIVGHPGNPTGGGCDAASLAAVAALCAERDVLLVSDEVYRDLHYGEPTPGLRDVSRGGLVLSSASKGFGAPGLRVGWVSGASPLLAPIRVVHGYAVTSAALPSQLAVAAMLEDRDAVLENSRRELRARYDALAQAMRSELGREIRPPSGGFYHFMRLPDSAHGDPFAWCLRLRDEAKVVLIPGLAFGEAGRAYARLSFAAQPEAVAEGVRRLARFLR